MRVIVPNTNLFKPIILKLKTFYLILFIIAIVRLYIVFCIFGGQYSPRRAERKPPGKNFSTIGIFNNNTSKYAKLMVEPFIGDNLN